MAFMDRFRSVSIDGRNLWLEQMSMQGIHTESTSHYLTIALGTHWINITLG